MKLGKKEKIRIVIIAIITLAIAIVIAVITTFIFSKKSNQTSSYQLEEDNVVTQNDILEGDLEDIELEDELANETENQTEAKIKSKTSTSNTGKTPYKIEVNCEQNVVNIYGKDESEEYTKCIKAMLCSVGTATPRSGTYSLKKYKGWEWKGLFGDVYGQYASQITGNILFHSVPYTEKYNKSSLEYWKYDKLGTAASMGCIRLTVKDVKWIYDNCATGTKVTFYNDSNPGPLGKPTAQKISSKTEYNGWDPTDPDGNNPWKNNGQTLENETNNMVKNEITNEADNSTNTNVNNTIKNDVIDNNTMNTNIINTTVTNTTVTNTTTTNTTNTNNVIKNNTTNSTITNNKQTDINNKLEN